MNYSNVNGIFYTNLTNTHKCLEKILFLHRSDAFVAFVDVGQIGGTNFVYIVELHVKLESRQIKFMEMTYKIRRFTPIFVSPEFLSKKHAKISTFQNIFFSLFPPKTSHNW
jgi:hypothetical protein